MKYWDQDTGWTDCDMSFEESLDTLREDGQVQIIADTGPQGALDLGHRVIVGTCGDKLFILSHTTVDNYDTVRPVGFVFGC